jgi:phosphoribosylglycinamide formyltransferase-1
MADRQRVAILISGRGSNMRALVEDAAGYDVVLVASNKPHAAGLDWARSRGLPTWAWDSKSVARDTFDSALGDAIEEHQAGTIALAGYMRILSPAFVSRFEERIVNIHPSLLPKYRGLDTHERVLAAGDKLSGCTVHLVTEELDSGEILGQAEVLLEPGDTAATLEQRILASEHLLYPRALGEFVKR